MIETDYHVGRILKFLEEAKIDENTLIVYTSDNGPERSWKSRIADTGHDSRGGLREGKRSVYEGGHRVPFIVRWPAGIAEAGRSWDGLVGQTDLLATFADLVKFKLPDNAGEDSLSFLPVLLDPKSNLQRFPLINKGNDNRYAITEGSWKLILPSARHQKPSLFNLANDLSETKNIAEQHPERVANLTAKINQYITSGRSTPGPKQANDTDYWKQLFWMTAEEYEKSRSSPQEN